jgi:hypothetical protein
MSGKRPDGWSWIRNFHICWTRVRTMLTDVRTGEFELRFLPYKWARPEGNPRRPDSCNNLPIFELGKNLKLDRILRGVRTGCWDVRTDASWNRSFSIQRSVRTEIHVVRTDDALVCRGSGRYDTSSERLEVWTDGRPDGMTRHSDDWQGTENLLTCKQCRVFWKYSK